MICTLVQAPPRAFDGIEWKELDNSILEIGLFEGDRIYRRKIGANMWEIHTRSEKHLEKFWDATPAASGAKVLTPTQGRALGLVSQISRFDQGREAEAKNIEKLKTKVK
jgi:hypothetical protein